MTAITDASSYRSSSIDVVPITASDGARSELICVAARPYPIHALYWLPAMGVAAKHYLPWAQALAAHGISVALHEWRGMGSSDRRAGRKSNWGYRELLTLDLPAGMQQAQARWPEAKCWVGGHSLGGQLACLYAGLHAQDIAGVALLASGAPYWRKFSFAPLIFAAYALAMPLSTLTGYLPGRRIGFGGNEARGVIADWSRSGRTGRYTAHGMDIDIEQHLAQVEAPILAWRLRDDWLAPASSLVWLLDKMPRAAKRMQVVTPDQLGGSAANHFDWMKAPEAIAAQLAGSMKANCDCPT